MAHAVYGVLAAPAARDVRIIPVPYSPLNASTPRGSAWACVGTVVALWRGRFLAIGQR